MSLAIPIAPWARGYQRAWLSKDIVGGLAAGAVVIPQAMAYATIANLPVQVGLYTCLVPMAVYALLGGSRTLSVSTTSTVAILTGSTLLAANVASGSDYPARDLATLTVLVGAILLIARVLRLGGIVDNISEATLTGIKIGVGLTVAAGQLPAVLGVASDPDADNFFAEMGAVLRALDDVSVATLTFSAGTLVVLLVLKRVAPRIPGPLVAVAGGILLVAVASIDEHGIALITEVPSGLPTPVNPSFEHFSELLPGAFAIAIMVFLETLAVGRSVRRSTEPPIDNDQELVANGLSCVAGAFFRAMPSAGGFSQTAINQGAGARTQLSELVTVVLAVACALFLGPVLSDLPQATLACLVIVAVLGLIEPREFVEFWKINRLEFWVAVVTAVSGLVFGLLVAVLVGVLLTLFLVLLELDRIGVSELQPTVDGDDVEIAGPRTTPVPGLLIVRPDGPLYSANVRSVNRKVVAVLAAHPGTRVLVFDLSPVGRLSVSVMAEFAQFDKDVRDLGATIHFGALRPAVRDAAQHLPHWHEFEAAGRVHPTVLAAVRAYRETNSSGGEARDRDAD